MKRKRNLKVGDGLSPSAVGERWTRRGGGVAMAGSGPPGTPGLGGGYHRRCSSSAQFKLTRFSDPFFPPFFPFFLVSIVAAAWALSPFGDSGLVGPSRGRRPREPGRWKERRFTGVIMVFWNVVSRQAAEAQRTTAESSPLRLRGLARNRVPFFRVSVDGVSREESGRRGPRTRADLAGPIR